jgi:hypothetical protein
MRNLTVLVFRGVVLALFAFPLSAQTYTGAPFETICQNASGSGPVAAGGSVTCTLKANLSIPQAAPFTVTPALSAGLTITGCATPYPPDTMAAQSGGATLPVFKTFQSPTGSAHTAIGHGLAGLTVPQNTCAFTWLVEVPSTEPPSPPFVAPAGTVIGTETFTVANGIKCGAEIARQAGAQWISNGDFSIIASDGNPIASTDVGFGATISGGFLRCGSDHARSRPGVDTGMPAQTSCTSSRGPLFPGMTGTCTVTNNLFLPTGGTLLVRPLTPIGTEDKITVTGCRSSTPGIVANGPGGTLPSMVTYTLLPFMPQGGTAFMFQAQLGTSTTVPANTCAFTSLGAANPAGIPGDTVVGTETISLPKAGLKCGTELTQRAVSYVPNGSSVMWPDEFGGFDTYFPETTASRISAGFLCRKGDSTTLSKFTNTGLPLEFRCRTPNDRPLDAGGTVTCTITNNVLQYTGNTVFVSPTAPSGATVTSCSTTTSGVLATGPGQNLPTFSQTKGVIVSPDIFPSRIIQAGALDSNGNVITTVPANTCAFTVVKPTPSGARAGEVLGTETVSIQLEPDNDGHRHNTTELRQRADVYENVGVAFGFNCSALVTALADPSLCLPPAKISKIVAPFLWPVFDSSGHIVLGSAGVPEESVQDVYAGTAGFRIHHSSEDQE